MNDTMPMMEMVFKFSRTVPGGHLLFPTWRVNSVGGIIGAVFAVFFMAVLYEGLKTLREYLVYRDWRHWKDHTSRHECSLRPIHDDDDDDTDRGTLIPSQRRQHKNKDKGFKYYSISVSMHVIQSLLHVVQVGYAYLLMLVAMTFNAWLFLAVCFGAGMGYFIFAKSRHLMGNFREQNEHCH